MGKLTVTLTTDAPEQGWGGLKTENGQSTTRTEGRWSETEQDLHVNSKETPTICHSLLAFCGKVVCT